MTPREEFEAQVAEAVARADAAIERSDRVIDRGRGDDGNYVPIEDDPTVPSWRDLEASMTPLDTGKTRAVPTLSGVDVEAEILTNYQPHRRPWTFYLGVAVLAFIAAVFVTAFVLAIANTEPYTPAPGQTWSGEF